VSTDPAVNGNPGRHRRPKSQPDLDAIWGRLAPVIVAWRRWRHSRPFWGGFFVLLGGTVIMLSERAPLPIMVHIGLQGVAGYLVPAVLLLCGVLLWFNPAQRTFYSLLAVLLALGSWITSNLGGFFVGMLLGLVGGSLAFAWQPRDSTPAEHAEGPEPKQTSAGLSLITSEPGAQPDAPAPGEVCAEQERDPLTPGKDSRKRALSAMRVSVRRVTVHQGSLGPV
jgi:hypothetical protein